MAIPSSSPTAAEIRLRMRESERQFVLKAPGSNTFKRIWPEQRG